MATGLLKPLAVFSCQSQSQRYIKSIRNLGDAWRSLAEKPLLESERNFVVVETQFDFTLKIAKPLEEQQLSKLPIVQMSTGENQYPSSAEQIPSEDHTPEEQHLSKQPTAQISTDEFLSPSSTGQIELEEHSLEEQHLPEQNRRPSSAKQVAPGEHPQEDRPKEEQRMSRPDERLLNSSAGQVVSENYPRHYRIFADYGTDFIWRDPNDVRPEEGDTVLDPEEVLASYPPSVLELYDSWVDTYTESFRRRRDETGDYKATTFPTASEEVAWNVAGFLLAWRIAMAPDVAEIEFAAGSSRYILKRGEETGVTLEFLRDQVDILEKGPVG